MHNDSPATLLVKMIKHEMFALSTILYYRIGGVARWLFEARRPDDVIEALDIALGTGYGKLIVVGTGSNLLFPDGVFEGVVLRLTSGESLIEDLGDGRVRAYAGEELDSVISLGFSRGYVGLEWAGGLPGTVGAAIRGNVGAFGGELKDVLESAEILDFSGYSPKVRNLANRDLDFAYRDSLVKRNGRMVILSAVFALKEATPRAIEGARRVYEANIAYRQTYHPMEYPTCGSVFKNIKRKGEVDRVLDIWPDARSLVETKWHGKVSMGYAINRLGLKGLQIGGAQISTKHNNFIVNLGNATFSDVNALIETVKERFEATFGFLPEAEVEIVGRDR